MSTTPTPRFSKFDTGQVVATAGVAEAEDMAELVTLLRRHETGDWGDVDAEDKAANEAGLDGSDRLLSKYTLANGHEVYIITEIDRTYTTILYPSEY